MAQFCLQQIHLLEMGRCPLCRSKKGGGCFACANARVVEAQARASRGTRSGIIEAQLHEAHAADGDVTDACTTCGASSATFRVTLSMIFRDLTDMHAHTTQMSTSIDKLGQELNELHSGIDSVQAQQWQVEAMDERLWRSLEDLDTRRVVQAEIDGVAPKIRCELSTIVE